MSLPPVPLPEGIASRQVETAAGLNVHYLEAGAPGRPLLLLLHGFPELAFSWRRVMPALAAAGYRVVAPDQRGYGRTTGWSADYDGDLAPFAMPGLVLDALALVEALGESQVHCVVGHDFGAPVAAWSALIRPDVFRRAVVMSNPFAGPPAIGGAPGLADPALHTALAALSPPRLHYQWYYATRQAAADMERPPQGLHAFLRAYFHMKSADWPGNRPYRLGAFTAEELAKLPHYYVMEAGADMPASVAPEMPAQGQIDGCAWLPDDALAFYAAEFARTGFQGGLNWYRCGVDARFARALSLYAGRRLDVPAMFIAGAADWGYLQKPGDLEAMETRATSDYRGTRLIEGAGHWVQQEQPERVVEAVLGFLDAT